MALSTNYPTKSGFPQPFGTSKLDNGINFALFSQAAARVTLVLFSADSKSIVSKFKLDPLVNKTGDVWHILIEGISHELLYAFYIEASSTNDGITTPSKPVPLLDPYAKEVASSIRWASQSNQAEAENIAYLPFGRLSLDSTFDWNGDRNPNIPLQDLIIYEMHVRGFTIHESSKVDKKGTFLGVIEKIPHFIELGINAIELMPIHEFNENEYAVCSLINKQRLYQFWGYSTVNFFAPMNRYASEGGLGTSINEFKTMVKELHKNGIEVILDVVFNHTAEGNEEGPLISYKGIDKDTYYILDSQGNYMNYTGTGNTFNCNHPVSWELILDCLRYWVVEMHVDGFRFDLASILTRGTNGEPLQLPPIIDAITYDPILSQTKLIAEPWDAGGLYQVGSFFPNSKRWSEWNGQYRDVVRRFIKKTPGYIGQFATRICGSQDLYYNRYPTSSINFITAHDGFTLHDLVSYNQKHNLANGEDNRDGNSSNDSWNCGVEGPTGNPNILALRGRQMRNFHLALMLSQGIPMLFMGDEYGHTRHGNNNPWCQDNELNWFLWDQLEEKKGFYRYYRLLIHFRRDHYLLRKSSFLTNKDIDWHGTKPFQADWSGTSSFIAFTLVDFESNQNLYAAFNVNDSMLNVEIPPPPENKTWHWVVNTANASPNDFFEDQSANQLKAKTIKMIGYSAILLKAL